jgi:hypothetical protein
MAEGKEWSGTMMEMAAISKIQQTQTESQATPVKTAPVKAAVIEATLNKEEVLRES